MLYCRAGASETQPQPLGPDTVPATATALPLVDVQFAVWPTPGRTTLAETVNFNGSSPFMSVSISKY
jgi:hypothetical protein